VWSFLSRPHIDELNFANYEYFFERSQEIKGGMEHDERYLTAKIAKHAKVREEIIFVLKANSFT
jgi:hypothetical protein